MNRRKLVSLTLGGVVTALSGCMTDVDEATLYRNRDDTNDERSKRGSRYGQEKPEQNNKQLQSLENTTAHNQTVGIDPTKSIDSIVNNREEFSVTRKPKDTPKKLALHVAESWIQGKWENISEVAVPTGTWPDDKKVSNYSIISNNDINIDKVEIVKNNVLPPKRLKDSLADRGKQQKFRTRAMAKRINTLLGDRTTRQVTAKYYLDVGPESINHGFVMSVTRNNIEPKSSRVNVTGIRTFLMVKYKSGWLIV